MAKSVWNSARTFGFANIYAMLHTYYAEVPAGTPATKAGFMAWCESKGFKGIDPASVFIQECRPSNRRQVRSCPICNAAGHYALNASGMVEATPFEDAPFVTDAKRAGTYVAKPRGVVAPVAPVDAELAAKIATLTAEHNAAREQARNVEQARNAVGLLTDEQRALLLAELTK